MFLVGLTGGIGTGKSLVATLFRDHGIPIVDADVIARQIVEPGQPAYNKIRTSFGDHVFKENGELDRIQLGKEIFSDVEKRKLLNSITHPYIYSEMKKQAFKYFIKGEQFIVMDLPLLYETRSVLPYIHKTIVVACEPEIQLQRIMARNSFSAAEGRRRIEAQMSLEEKVDMADYVIENSGSIAETRKQVKDILRVLQASKHHIWNRITILGGAFLIAALLLMLLLIFTRWFGF